jgi:hypothetical protein
LLFTWIDSWSTNFTCSGAAQCHKIPLNSLFGIAQPFQFVAIEHMILAWVVYIPIVTEIASATAFLLKVKK